MYTFFSLLWKIIVLGKRSQRKYNDEPTLIQCHDDIESTLIKHCVFAFDRSKQIKGRK